MKKSNIRGLFGVLIAVLAVLAVGNVKAETPAATDIGGKDLAVACDKCETVWVQRADRVGKDSVVYRKEKKMECPDCQSAIITFFKTGKFEHTCKSCGGTLNHCEVHEEAVAPAATKVTESSADEDHAVMCGKCQTVWVRRAQTVGSHNTIIYRKEKSMECPDCKSAAANFLTTGKLEHTCATCGDSMAMCAACK